MSKRMEKWLLIIICTVWLSESKLSIQTPPALKNIFDVKYNNESIPYSIANFGKIPYGKSITGEMAVPTVLEDCIYEEMADVTSYKKVVLVARSDCTFTQKAINVQKEGGKMAIIMDSEVENPGRIVMVDDGKGNQVHIPTILISKEDGETILTFLENQQSVVITINFQIQTQPKADVELWMDINDRKNIVFLRNFKPYFQKLNSLINFNIGYSTIRCNYCGDSNCFFTNLYCKIPSHSWGAEDGGKNLILEQLRQYYIFKQNSSAWWEYMLGYDDLCDNLAIVEQCSTSLMQNLKIKSADIGTSVMNSFNESDNELLRNMSEFRYTHSIIYYPSIIVNNMIYRGNLEPLEVFNLICQSFQHIPNQCNLTVQIKTTDIALWVSIAVILFITFLIFLVVCYRRMARRQLSKNINKQVNELVNQYISMYENQKFNGETPAKQLQNYNK